MAKKIENPGKVYCVISLSGKLVSAHETSADAREALGYYRENFGEYESLGKIVPGRITF